MGHETVSLRPLARLVPDMFIEFVDVFRQVIVEPL